MMCVLAVGLAVGTICPVACSTPLQGTCASRPRESTGTTVVDAARTEGKNAAGKPLGRRREWQHQHQHQDGSPQHQGEGQARSWLFSPCLDGGVATLVLAAALLCRLGDYAQASCSCGNCGIDISCYRVFRPTIADASTSSCGHVFPALGTMSFCVSCLSPRLSPPLRCFDRIYFPRPQPLFVNVLG